MQLGWHADRSGTGLTRAAFALALAACALWPAGYLLGSAWPGHFNKTIAETMHANIEKVGLPQWSDADQTLAKALQHELKVPEVGLATKIPALRGREVIPDEEKRGGGSADAAAILRWAGYTDVIGAADLGADVAFCLVGGRARVRGIGEVVDPMPFVPIDITP